VKYSDVRRNTPVEAIIPLIERPPLPGEEWPKASIGWRNVQLAHVLEMNRFAAGLNGPYLNKDGFGVVICGGGDYLMGAWIVAKAVRHLGFTGRIEVFYMGDRGEMPTEPQWELFDELKVHLRNAQAYGGCRSCRRNFGGWHLKPFALRQSAARHVLYLDADCYPVQPVQRLFFKYMSQGDGAMFWPDDEAHDLAPATWRALGVDDKPQWSFESGQMIVDTERHWRQLALADWINDHSDWYYKLFWGDKESFALAWRYFQTPYSMPSHRWCMVGHSLLQYDMDGRAAFVHRCKDKFTLRPKGGKKLFRHNAQSHDEQTMIPSLPLEFEVFRWRKEWIERTEF
jgi:hypothetical protein